MKKILLPLMAASLALGLAHAATAEVILYDNANPADSPNSFNGNSHAWTITNLTVGDTFVLTAPGTVSDVNFWSWTTPADTIDTVDWSITDLTGDTTYGSGTADVNNTFEFTNSNNPQYDINEVNFATGAVTLPTGTYILSLTGATTSDSAIAYWDEDDGPSSATSNGVPAPIGSESFQILGSPTPTPEPSGLVLLSIGTLFVGFYIMRRRQSVA